MNIFQKLMPALAILMSLFHGLSAMEQHPQAPQLSSVGENTRLLLAQREARLLAQDAQLDLIYMSVKAQTAQLDLLAVRVDGQHKVLIAKINEGENNLRVLEARMRQCSPQERPALEVEHKQLIENVGTLRRTETTFRIKEQKKEKVDSSGCLSCLDWLF